MVYLIKFINKEIVQSAYNKTNHGFILLYELSFSNLTLNLCCLLDSPEKKWNDGCMVSEEQRNSGRSTIDGRKSS